jgi:uncharacterized membrane protein
VTRQQASTVVAAPLDVVEARLRDVERWPEFLSEVAAVETAGFERYRFTVTDGRQRRVVLVCVVPHPNEHRISWRALEGPRYLGDFRLRVVDERHTKVDLTATLDPAGLMDGLREIVGERHMTAGLDLRRLEAYVTSTPSA